MREIQEILSFVDEVLELILEKQAYRTRWLANGDLLPAISRYSERSYTSVSGPIGGPYELQPNHQAALQATPVRMDVKLIPVLQRRGELPGGERWAGLAGRMLEVFAENGFDERSGLPYAGQEVEFSLLTLNGLPTGPESTDFPKFKPGKDMLPAALWDLVPEKMDRAMQSFWSGLMVDEEITSFNRWCLYNYRPERGERGLPFSPWHCGFQSTAAFVSDLWLDWTLRTGNELGAVWARRMTDKFLTARHPSSGLLPHMFGSVSPDAKSQEAYPMTHVHDTEDAVRWIAQVEQWRRLGRSSQDCDHDLQIHRDNLLMIARRAYRADSGTYLEWLNQDGTSAADLVRYAFPTEALKREAVAQDPACEAVSVFDAYGMYVDGPWNYGAHGFGVSLPKALMRGALLLNDREVFAAVTPMLERIREEFRRLSGEINENNQYVCTANAVHIRTFLDAFQFTRDPEYLKEALRMAEWEIGQLRLLTTGEEWESAPGLPAWWRLHLRSQVLESFLMIVQELGSVRS